MDEMLVENPKTFENNAFSVDDAMVRDIDMNSCVLESWGLALSNAQEFVAVQCTPASIKFDDYSLWRFYFVQENAVNSGDIFGNFKISTFSIEYSEATVRDIDINPCACESWDLELSHAQGFASIRCTPSSLIAHESCPSLRYLSNNIPK